MTRRSEGTTGASPRGARSTSTSNGRCSRGRTLGLVGFGTIARLVAEKARTFGMEIVASDPYVDAEEMARADVEKAAFERMKETAHLINVARGGLVFEAEPSGQGEGFPPFENPLRELDNVVLTPHAAWFSREANEERRRTAARDVRRVLDGEEPTNAVNEPRRVADGGDE